MDPEAEDLSSLLEERISGSGPNFPREGALGAGILHSATRQVVILLPIPLWKVRGPLEMLGETLIFASIR